ncbi:MAG: diguanylate cyclase [Candidatus Aminicenantes bacterium]|nr:diguanylate cyclase [Candidatus Aminicenantes bacterium]
MKVLVAEGDTDSCKALESDIKEWGYEVITANKGQDALELIKKGGIRIAILDWKMPEINGRELCRNIRKEIQERKSENIYVILLLGKDSENDIINGLSAGADDYIVKPINFLELKILIQNGDRIIKLEDSCIQLASFDPLTKLWNRNKIFQILDEELNRGWRENTHTGVVMIDVDHFKKINDSYGHLAGDAVLAEVASRIQKGLRPYDKAGRYGGDEMCVVLPKCNLNIVKLITERLRLSVCGKNIKTDAGLLNVSISIGGTISDNSSHSSGNIFIKISDEALYLAKEKGRNRIVILESGPQSLKK